MSSWDLPDDLGSLLHNDSDVETFKWAWNPDHGALVWRVGGPGDGLPHHEEGIREAWGRGFESSLGDVLGAAELAPARGDDPETVRVSAYYGVAIPAAVRSWFEAAFPKARVR